MNMMAKIDPSTPPINAPETEVSFNDWTPLPANRKLPQYASAMVQTIMRTKVMGGVTSQCANIATNSTCGLKIFKVSWLE
jgi:hypothetical protein